MHLPNLTPLWHFFAVKSTNHSHVMTMLNEWLGCTTIGSPIERRKKWELHNLSMTGKRPVVSDQSGTWCLNEEIGKCCRKKDNRKTDCQFMQEEINSTSFHDNRASASTKSCTESGTFMLQQDQGNQGSAKNHEGNTKKKSHISVNQGICEYTRVLREDQVCRHNELDTGKKL